MAGTEYRVDWKALKQFTRDVTPFAIAPQHHHALAFCYLVNSGATRPHVLEGFQAAREN